MQPKWHLLYSFIFSFILIYFFEISLFYGAILFISSLLIDLDHFLLYILEKKSFHPIKFLSWSDKKTLAWKKLGASAKNYRAPQFILHGIEFILILILLAVFINKIFLFILIGVLFHLFLDYLEFFYYGHQFNHVSHKISQIWVWHNNRNKDLFSFE